MDRASPPGLRNHSGIERYEYIPGDGGGGGFTKRRPAARAIYIYFLRPLQDGGYSTRETGNYQNNTPASQWLAHIGLGHI